MGKKLRWVFSSVLTVGLLSVPAAASGASSGTWSPQPPSYAIPASFHCGGTSGRNGIYAQNCLVRSGNYVQSALIVRNNTGKAVGVAASVGAFTVNQAALYVADCQSSSMSSTTGAISICFGPTVTSSLPVQARATLVTSADNAALSVLPSPFA